MTKLSVHLDADGISSGVLVAKALGLKLNKFTVNFPEEFGNVDEDTDYVCDMRPINPNITATVFDHHENPPHPKKDKRKYKLIFDSVPTALVVYNHFKNKIPKEETWKSIVGVMGDMSPEVIPLEIFKAHPSLLNKELYIDQGYDNYDDKGTISLSLFKFQQLSSPINAITRFGQHKEAFDILFNAKTPDDILVNPTLKKYQNKQKTATSDVFKSWGNTLPRPKSIKNLFLFAVIDTPIGLQGTMATILEDKNDMTTVCLNLNTGAISIRGTFTNIVCEAFNKHKIECGGHSVASGGSLPDNMNYNDLIKILENII